MKEAIILQSKHDEIYFSHLAGLLVSFSASQDAWPKGQSVLAAASQLYFRSLHLKPGSMNTCNSWTMQHESPMLTLINKQQENDWNQQVDKLPDDGDFGDRGDLGELDLDLDLDLDRDGDLDLDREFDLESDRDRLPPLLSDLSAKKETHLSPEANAETRYFVTN